jgi:hypothetical protein
MSVSEFWLGVLASAVWSGLAWLLSTFVWPSLRRNWLEGGKSLRMRVWVMILSSQVCGWFIFYAGFVAPAAMLKAFPGGQLLFLTFPIVTTAFGALVYSTERALQSQP